MIRRGGTRMPPRSRSSGGNNWWKILLLVVIVALTLGTFVTVVFNSIHLKDIDGALHKHHDAAVVVSHGDDLHCAGLVHLDTFNGEHGKFDPAIGCPYEYFQDPTIPFIGNDGDIFREKGRIREKANPFEVTLSKIDEGATEHVKVLQYLTRFPLVKPHERLIYKIRISSRSFGVGNHPFPKQLVTDPWNDHRLGACAANTIDNGPNITLLVADWFLTETGLWTFYERLPFLQNVPPFGFYAAFSSTKFIKHRKPDDVHNLSIEYDRKHGTITWLCEGEVVMRIDRIGFLPKNQFQPDPKLIVILDHGGTEELLDLTGLRPGWGCFTLLDMCDPNNPNSTTGLVMLSSKANFYKKPLNFYDNLSLEKNRLFSGAEVTVYNVKVVVESSH